jgi:hypothetical protein
MTKIFEIAANSNLMGEYKGADADAAIDSYARDAGYEDFADLLGRVEGSSRGELEVFEIDTDKLIDAVTNVAGEAVFQDSYGDGVALVKNVSYATYRELADAFGLDIDDFRA